MHGVTRYLQSFNDLTLPPAEESATYTSGQCTMIWLRSIPDKFGTSAVASTKRIDKVCLGSWPGRDKGEWKRDLVNPCYVITCSLYTSSSARIGAQESENGPVRYNLSLFICDKIVTFHFETFWSSRNRNYETVTWTSECFKMKRNNFIANKPFWDQEVLKKAAKLCQTIQRTTVTETTEWTHLFIRLLFCSFEFIPIFS